MTNLAFADAPDTLHAHAWEYVNQDGISFSEIASWDRAHACFQEALEMAPAFPDAPSAHAVLLGNLAQCKFRLGDTEGAIQSARRALAARMMCCDDDGDAPMARIRSDLAVYLAASGAHEEAEATLSMAQSSLEWRYGDEDQRLITVLENQARLALASGRLSAAEPALLRLHALLVDAGEDPARLDPLFAMVSASRIFPTIVDDDVFDLIEDTSHASMRSPSAQAILTEGLIEPGTHSAPAHTNPLGFEVQYGIPQELLLESSSPIETGERD